MTKTHPPEVPIVNASPLPPLKDRVEAVLQCLAKDDPLLRKALDRRCDRKVDCVRGLFGCVCESREGLQGSPRATEPLSR